MINFTDWSCKGIKYLEHILEGTDFIPFDKLIKQYGINKNRFLEYQQIKSIVKRKFKSNHINLQITPSVSDFLNLKTPKLMSKIYRALSKIDESVSLPIAKWEADLSVSWDHNFWSQICLKTFELIRNPGLQLIQYKILHRVHYTGHRMFRMVLQLLTTAHTVKAIHLTITSTLYGSVHLFRGTGTGFVKTYQSVLNALFQPLL